MRQALLLLVVVGCARDGILHAEHLVERATCTDDGFAAFGYPIHEADCDLQIFALGDGCYVSNRPGQRQRVPRQVNRVGGERVWGYHLYQCDYDALPDGHIACGEDELPPRDAGADDAPRYQGILLRAHLPGQPEPHVDTPLGRCRTRFHAWEAFYIPRPDPVTLVVSRVDRVSGPDVLYGNPVPATSGELRVDEDGLELSRAAGPVDAIDERAVTAHVCHDQAGVTVEMPAHYPSRFEHELRDLFASAMSSWRVATPCAWLALHYRVKT